VSDLKSMKTVKLERKRSQDKQPQFGNHTTVHPSTQLLQATQQSPAQFARPVRLDPKREVARTADECWDEIQGRIQAVRQ